MIRKLRVSETGNRKIIKRILIALGIVIIVFVLLVVAFFVWLDIGIRHNEIAGDDLRQNGPWGRGEIWVSTDGNYYLVPVEEEGEIYFYAYVGEAWVKSFFYPYAATASGRCLFTGSGPEKYELYWEASVKDDSLILKTEWYPSRKNGRLPCPREIIFYKTNKTADDLPFKEDLEELREYIESLRQDGRK
jgi:hypothetical protein